LRHALGNVLLQAVPVGFFAGKSAGVRSNHSADGTDGADLGDAGTHPLKGFGGHGTDHGLTQLYGALRRSEIRP
jgi:hypothetical protein